MADGGPGLQDDELYLPRSKSCWNYKAGHLIKLK